MFGLYETSFMVFQTFSRQTLHNIVYITQSSQNTNLKVLTEVLNAWIQSVPR